MQQVLTQPPTAEPISLVKAKLHLRIDSSSEDTLITELIRTARQYVEDYTRRALVSQSWQATFSRFPSLIELPILPVRKVSSIQYVDSAGATQTWAASNYQVDQLSSDRVRILPVFAETWPTIQDNTFNAVIVDFIAGHSVVFSSAFGSDANQMDAVGHPLADGDALQLWNTGGGLPAGLAAYTNYFVVNAITDAFEVSLTSGGAPVAMTSDGTGTHFVGLIPGPLVSAMLLLIGHLYENREQSIVGSLNEIPMGVESLLIPYTSMRF